MKQLEAEYCQNKSYQVLPSAHSYYIVYIYAGFQIFSFKGKVSSMKNCNGSVDMGLTKLSEVFH